jgi:nitric oxide reductase large subunit
MNTLITTLATTWATEGPKPEDVKAGWTAFVVFLLLLAAVALLGWSLSRQLKKAERNKEAGILPSSKKERQGHAPQA